MGFFSPDKLDDSLLQNQVQTKALTGIQKGFTRQQSRVTKSIQLKLRLAKHIQPQKRYNGEGRVMSSTSIQLRKHSGPTDLFINIKHFQKTP